MQPLPLQMSQDMQLTLAPANGMQATTNPITVCDKAKAEVDCNSRTDQVRYFHVTLS